MARNVGPIQVAMAGLYGMLGVKDGSNPDVITGFVQPTLEAASWWLRAVSVPTMQTLPITAAGDSYQLPELLASQQEWLHVEYAMASTVTGGAATDPLIKFIVMQPTPGVTIWDTGWHDYVAVSGAHVATVQVRDIWIPPGFGLRAVVEEGFVGGGVTIGALITRLRI